MPTRPPLSRRGFLGAGSAGLAAGLGGLGGSVVQCEDTQPAIPAGRVPRVASINSIYRLRSHAYHIAGRFVYGYTHNGFHHQPPFQLVRMYNDQAPADDLGPRVCKDHDIELVRTVPEALGTNGGLDVDAVLLIIEHGDYPLNDLQQVMYPRYELFEQVVSVFRKVGRSVPVFVDKHLSYNSQNAAKMVATAKELGFGLMAGSSLPVTWRIPEIEPPLETPFREAVVTFGFDRGTVEIYLFHALETLQCMLERRKGGETGVSKVTTLRGPAVWAAIDSGRISARLVHAALAPCPTHNTGPLRENVLDPLAVLVDYRDGTKGAVLNLIEQTSEFGFAGTVAGRPDPVATCFYLPGPPGARFFDPLTHNIEKFFATGKSPYPVERTLLTSTLCDLGMRSLKEQKPVESPALDIRYAAPESTGFFRGPFTDAGTM